MVKVLNSCGGNPFYSGGFKSQQCQQLLTGPPKNFVCRAPPNKSGPHLKRIVQASMLKDPSGITSGRAENLFFFSHFLKLLKFVLGLPKWKFYATEGPPPSAADRALFRKSASADLIKNRLGRNEMWCKKDNHNYICRICARRFCLYLRCCHGQNIIFQEIDPNFTYS